MTQQTVRTDPEPTEAAAPQAAEAPAASTASPAPVEPDTASYTRPEPAPAPEPARAAAVEPEPAPVPSPPPAPRVKPAKKTPAPPPTPARAEQPPPPTVAAPVAAAMMRPAPDEPAPRQDTVSPDAASATEPSAAPAPAEESVETGVEAPDVPMAVPAPAPDETLLAMAAPAPAVPAVELDELPMAINANWTLTRGPEPLSGRDRCFLRSAEQRMEDGQGVARTAVYVTLDSVRVATRANIDTEYTGTGIRIDDNEQFPLDSVFKDTSAVFSSSVPRVHEELKGGQALTVTLGFWPTWPMTRTYSTTFDIQGYASAHAALLECEKIEF